MNTLALQILSLKLTFILQTAPAATEVANGFDTIEGKSKWYETEENKMLDSHLPPFSVSFSYPVN